MIYHSQDHEHQEDKTYHVPHEPFFTLKQATWSLHLLDANPMRIYSPTWTLTSDLFVMTQAFCPGCVAATCTPNQGFWLLSVGCPCKLRMLGISSDLVGNVVVSRPTPVLLVTIHPTRKLLRKSSLEHFAKPRNRPS